MHLEALNTVLNMLLFALWFRIWTTDDRDTFFNPYLAPVAKMSNFLLDPLKPVFRGLPNPICATVVLVFLLILRGMAIPQEADWRLVLGVERLVDSNRTIPFISFSFLSFAIFLFRLWSVALLYVSSQKTHWGRAGGAVRCLARPFSNLPQLLQPIVLLGIGTLLALGIDSFGHRPGIPSDMGMGFINTDLGFGTNPPAILFLKFILVSALGMTSVLGLMHSMMIVFIIGSWIAMFARSSEAMALCRDGIDFLLGPLRNRRVMIGSFDLSALAFIIVVGILHGAMFSIISGSLQALD